MELINYGAIIIKYVSVSVFLP